MLAVIVRILRLIKGYAPFPPDFTIQPKSFLKTGKNSFDHSGRIRLSQCTYKNMLRRFSSRFGSFLRCSLFYLPYHDMLDSFCPISKCLTTYSSILPSVFVSGASRALIAKTKSNPPQGHEATLLKVLHSCHMFGYRWEGRCSRLKTSTCKPCHIICQLGSGLR